MSINEQLTNILSKAKNVLNWIKNHQTKSVLILFLFFSVFYFYTVNLPKLVDNQETVIIGQTVISPGSQAGMRIAVLNHKNRQPIKKADVEVVLEDKKDKNKIVLFSGKTNETGTADISFIVPENFSGEKNIVIKTKSKEGKDELKRKVKIERKAKIMLSADKPIYQPGQTIHIRSLVFDANTLKSVKNEKSVITVEDSKGNRIFKKIIQTNDYGIVSADFVLGSEINLGPYKITAEAGGYKAERTVEVKKYVLPKFKIDLATDKEYYLPKQKLFGSVSAQYFFGKPVENSRVVIRAYTYENELKEFKSIESKTNNEGNVSFEFVLPDYFVRLPLDKGKGMVVLEAEVTDQANQIQKARKKIPVSKDNLIIEVYPEGGNIKPKLKNIINIVASYPNGTPAKAELNIDALCGKSNNISLYNLDESKFTGKIKTNVYGLAQFKLESGLCNVKLTINAKDKIGNSAKINKGFKVEGKYEYVLIRPDKYVSQVGDTLRLDILTSGNQKNVYVDIIKNSQTLLTKSVMTENGAASFDIDIAPEMAGTLEIHAYKILSSLDITRDTKIVFVNQPSDITISSKLDSSRYKPGETAKVDFEVLNKSNPQQAALGITAVDESVFSLAEEQAGLEKIYFLLEKQILESKLDVHGFSIKDLVDGGIKNGYENLSGTESVDAKSIETARQNMAGIILAQASSNAEFGLSVNTNTEKKIEMQKKMTGNFGFLAKFSLLFLIIISIFPILEVFKEIKRENLFHKVLIIFWKIFASVLFIYLFLIFLIYAMGGGDMGWRYFLLFFLIVIIFILVIFTFAGTIKQGVSRRTIKNFLFLFIIIIFWFILTNYDSLLKDSPLKIIPFVPIIIIISLILGSVFSFFATIIKREDVVLSRMFGFSVLFIIFFASLIYFVRKSGGYIFGRPFPSDLILYTLWIIVGFVILAWFVKIFVLILKKKSELGLAILMLLFIIPMILYAMIIIVSTVILDSGDLRDGRNLQSSPNIERGDWERRPINSWGAQAPKGVPTTLGLPVPLSFNNSLSVAEKKMNLGLNRQKRAETKKAPRIRELFPETLYYNPVVITDENGKASVEIPLADSITSWRVNALASTKNGKFGSGNIPIIVFQDFFIDLDLPVSLTEGDEISIPVAVYNYLSGKQYIEINIEKADWFELMDSESKIISLEKNGVGSVYFRIKVNKIGFHNLTVKAFGSSLSDAIKRRVEIVPNGKKIENSINNGIKDKNSETVIIPDEAIEDSQKMYVKIYPRFISQVVEGMDGILTMPHGCFEQASSTTYPNVLALDYMQKTKQITPEIQMKAEQYINVGYQKLVSFEVDGGGFSLFGKAPANEILTAYGLMEFSDMSKVYDVDQRLIERTAKWLASKQNPDGSWDVSKGFYHEADRDISKIKNSAYILWSLVKAGYSGPEIEKGLGYLINNFKNTDDAYTLAVVANVFLDYGDTINGNNVLNKLIELKTEEKGFVYWKSSSKTYMGGRGNSANIEATAYATMALRKADRNLEISEKVLDWLIKQKNSRGLWGSTKTTVAVMQALIYAVEKQTAIEGKLRLRINGGDWKEVEITKENSDVMKIIDLTSEMKNAENKIDFRYDGESSVYYQVDFSYYVHWDNFLESPAQKSPIKIDVSYDNSNLRVNDTIKANIEMVNDSNFDANLIVADIGIPAGFIVNVDDFDYILKKGKKDKSKGFGGVEKYEIIGRRIVLYLNKLSKGQKISFWYRLTAKYPIRAKSFPSLIYEYYNPDIMNIVKPVEIRVD